MNKCICCGDDKFKTVFRWLDTGRKDVRVDQCSSCGLMRQDPIEDERELNLLYGDEFFSAYEKYFLEFRQKQFHRDIGIINALKSPPGKLLDIGCAFGIFLDEARKSGWNVSGIDISKNAVEYARKKYGLDVFMGTLTDAKIEGSSMDVVTAWDVIEHLIDPAKFLEEVGRILKKGGILAIRTPNAECLFLKVNKFVNAILGDRFAKVGNKFEHHKYLFSVSSLKSILNKNGFEIMDMRMELEDLIIVDDPSLMNYMKAFVKKAVKILEFFNKKRRASIVAYARKV